MRALGLGLVVSLALPLGPLAAPAAAQTMLKTAPVDKSQPRTKFVTTYGSDPCPKSTDPDEIIVCTNRPDEERFRVPEAVRSDTGRPVGPNERDRAALLGDAAGGAGGGIGSCTAVGPGGGIGCQQQLQNQYRAAVKAGDVPGRP